MTATTQQQQQTTHADAQDIGQSDNSEAHAIIVHDPLPQGGTITTMRTWHTGGPDGCDSQSDFIANGIHVGAYSKSGSNFTLLREVTVPSYACVEDQEITTVLTTALTVNAGEYVGYYNDYGDTEAWKNSDNDAPFASSTLVRHRHQISLYCIASRSA